MTENAPPPKKNAREIVAERKAKQQKTEPKKTPPPNWPLRILLAVVVLILGAAGAIYFLPALKDRLPVATWVGETSRPDSVLTENSELAEKIAALEGRLTRQDIDIQALKSLSNEKPEPDPLLLERLDSLERAGNRKDDLSQSARIDMLLSRISQLETSFVPLSKSLADTQEMRLERSQLAEKAATQAQQLGKMENRLSRVEAFAARDNSGALIAFRIGELRRKVTSGAAFGAEIDALRILLSRGSIGLNDQITAALDRLNQHRDGIATGARLRDQFNDLIPKLIRAESIHSDDPWWRRAYNSTRSLIMVRKTENTDGEDLDAIITNAHQMLGRLDLDQALSLLKQLPENMRQMLDVWIMRAEIYLQAGDELNQLENLTAAYYLEDEEKAEKAAL